MLLIVRLKSEQRDIRLAYDNKIHMKRGGALFIITVFCLTIGVIVGLMIKRGVGAPTALTLTKPIPVSTIAPISAPRKIEFDQTGVVFSYVGPVQALPENLPTYAVEYPSNLTDSSAKMAKQLGFIIGVKNPVPYVYDWVEKNRLFTYNDRSKAVSFAAFSPSAAPGSLLISDVFSDLSSFGFLSESLSLIESGRQRATKNADGESPADPSLSIITYQAVLKDRQIPCFFTALTKTFGEVRVDSKDNVVSFSFFTTPRLIQEQERRLLTLDEAIKALNEQKGYLEGIINNASGYGSGEAPSFSEVEITSVSVAYLYITEQSRLVPIYVFGGIGQGKTPQSVRYYLRASS